jgi:hypothetical protein
MPRLNRQDREDDALMQLKETLESAQFGPEQLRLFCDGLLNKLVVAQTVFQKRFPAEHAKWEAED